MKALLDAATLLCLGAVSGIYLSGPIHDHRVSDLSAQQYVAMHQMRDKTFKRVMPWAALSTVALVVAFALICAPPGVSRAWALGTLVPLVLDIAFTMRRQLPVNQAVQRWTPHTIPTDWSRYRDTWAHQHNVRIALCLLADACLLAAQMTGA